jgi:hypothetical protein
MNWKLCALIGEDAYFTPHDPGRVWGDDWDDKPANLNAEGPSTVHEAHTGERRDLRPEEVLKVKFEGWEQQRPGAAVEGQAERGMSVDAFSREVGEVGGAVYWRPRDLCLYYYLEKLCNEKGF